MPPTTRYPMVKLGHLHYQVRRLSGWCDGRPQPGAERCEVAFMAHGRCIALCTCECHAFNHAPAEAAA